jgi:hypothetical protein
MDSSDSAKKAIYFLEVNCLFGFVLELQYFHPYKL